MITYVVHFYLHVQNLLLFSYYPGLIAGLYVSNGCLNFALLSVNEEELKRLRMAFKRIAGASGVISKPLFFREVLGDNVPVKLAEVIIQLNLLLKYLEKYLAEHKLILSLVVIVLYICNFSSFLVNLANLPCLWWH